MTGVAKFVRRPGRRANKVSGNLEQTSLILFIVKLTKQA